MSTVAQLRTRTSRGYRVRLPAPDSSTSPPPVRCAIYTRKSTSEGLDSDFNTLDAQREACEAYIQSQRSEGWQLAPEHYDDGGCNGIGSRRPSRSSGWLRR